MGIFKSLKNLNITITSPLEFKPCKNLVLNNLVSLSIPYNILIGYYKESNILVDSLKSLIVYRDSQKPQNFDPKILNVIKNLGKVGKIELCGWFGGKNLVKWYEDSLSNSQDLKNINNITRLEIGLFSMTSELAVSLSSFLSNLPILRSLNFIIIYTNFENVNHSKKFLTIEDLRLEISDSIGDPLNFLLLFPNVSTITFLSNGEINSDKIFKNVKTLNVSLYGGRSFELKGLLDLLISFPNIKKLNLIPDKKRDCSRNIFLEYYHLFKDINKTSNVMHKYSFLFQLLRWTVDFPSSVGNKPEIILSVLKNLQKFSEALFREIVSRPLNYNQNSPFDTFKIYLACIDNRRKHYCLKPHNNSIVYIIDSIQIILMQAKNVLEDISGLTSIFDNFPNYESNYSLEKSELDNFFMSKILLHCCLND